VVAIESTFIFMVSAGVTVFVEVVSVVLGVTVLAVSTAVESALLDDIEDSLVPQLTATIPKPKAANKNFLIIFYF
jgi:hypothetical protein